MKLGLILVKRVPEEEKRVHSKEGVYDKLKGESTGQ